MAIPTTLGTVEYRENGGIAVPVTFPENVIAPSKSIFEITYVSGDALTDIEYRLVGQNTAFEVVIEVPPDRKGVMRLSMLGSVLKSGTGEWDSVTATAVEVPYGTIVPRIVDFDIPAQYAPGTNFDTRLAYNTRVTGLSLNNVQDVFLLEGAAEFMTPTPYKWIGSTPPDFTTAVPDDLTGTNWQRLQPPPALPANQRTAENDFDADGFWHGVANEGQYFLIRWLVGAGTVGIFSMTPRIGIGIRGRVN